MQNSPRAAKSSFIPEQIASLLPDLSPIAKDARPAVHITLHPDKDANSKEAGNRHPQDIGSVINALSSQMQGFNLQRLSMPLPVREEREDREEQVIEAVMHSKEASLSQRKSDLQSSNIFFKESDYSGVENSLESHISEYFDYLEGSYDTECGPVNEEYGNASNGPDVELPSRNIAKFSVPKPVAKKEVPAIKREEPVQSQSDERYELNEWRLEAENSFKSPETASPSKTAPKHTDLPPKHQDWSKKFDLIGTDYVPGRSDSQLSNLMDSKQKNIAELTSLLQIYREPDVQRETVEISVEEMIFKPENAENGISTRLNSIRERVHKMDRPRGQPAGASPMRAAAPLERGAQESQQPQFRELRQIQEQPQFQSPQGRQEEQEEEEEEEEEQQQLREDSGTVEIEEYYISSNSNVRGSLGPAEAVKAPGPQESLEFQEPPQQRPQRRQLEQKQKAPEVSPEAQRSPPARAPQNAAVGDSFSMKDLAGSSARAASRAVNQTSIASGICMSRRPVDFDTLRQRYEISKYRQADRREEEFMVSVRNFQAKLANNRSRCCTPSERAEKIRRLMRE